MKLGVMSALFHGRTLEQACEFCAMHGVTPTRGALAPASVGSAAHEWDWNLREARERHFRHEP